MKNAMFILKDNGELQQVNQEAYDSEALLQKLLALYPALIPGEQINDKEPRRWLLIAREAPIPDSEDGGNRWSADHLFLDQDGVPTIVEVKRSSDTRIRREVVGQMLDYAANAIVYWPVERVQGLYESSCRESGEDSDQKLQEFIGDETSQEDFWGWVKTNLQAGKVRLLFIADKIPRELQRIIEYLNGQMDPTEVLGVEIGQFVGDDLKALVPVVVGQTAEAEQKKSSGARQKRKWDEDSFCALLSQNYGQIAVSIARRLLDWARGKGLDIWWGEGFTMGSYLVRCQDHASPSVMHFMFSVWTYGSSHYAGLYNPKPSNYPI